MYREFMMPLLEKPMAKPTLADDFYVWYAEYKSAWKVRVYRFVP